MNKTILALLPLLAASPAWAAETYDDPKALVSAIYDSFQPGAAKGDASVHYSARLKLIAEESNDGAIFANDEAMAGAVFSPDIVFNPFLPDDNALLFDLVIGEPLQLNDRAVVSVSYHNFDEARLLSIALVREGDGWKVDDVASLGSGEPWLLSWALMYDPYAN